MRDLYQLAINNFDFNGVQYLLFVAVFIVAIAVILWAFFRAKDEGLL